MKRWIIAAGLVAGIIAIVGRHGGLESLSRKMARIGITYSPTVLARIAGTDWDWCVRKAAVEKLSNSYDRQTVQAIRAMIATTDRNWRVRCATVDKLTHQAAQGKLHETTRVQE